MFPDSGRLGNAWMPGPAWRPVLPPCWVPLGLLRCQKAEKNSEKAKTGLFQLFKYTYLGGLVVYIHFYIGGGNSNISLIFYITPKIGEDEAIITITIIITIIIIFFMIFIIYIIIMILILIALNIKNTKKCTRNSKQQERRTKKTKKNKQEQRGTKKNKNNKKQQKIIGKGWNWKKRFASPKTHKKKQNKKKKIPKQFRTHYIHNVIRCFYSGSFLRHHGNSMYSDKATCGFCRNMMQPHYIDFTWNR